MSKPADGNVTEPGVEVGPDMLAERLGTEPLIQKVSCDEWSEEIAPHISRYMCGIDCSQHNVVAPPLSVVKCLWGGVRLGFWGVVLVVCVCVGVGGVVVCRCVCVCDLLIFLQHNAHRFRPLQRAARDRDGLPALDARGRHRLQSDIGQSAGALRHRYIYIYIDR